MEGDLFWCNLNVCRWAGQVRLSQLRTSLSFGISLHLLFTPWCATYPFRFHSNLFDVRVYMRILEVGQGSTTRTAVVLT